MPEDCGKVSTVSDIWEKNFGKKTKGCYYQFCIESAEQYPDNIRVPCCFSSQGVRREQRKGLQSTFKSLFQIFRNNLVISFVYYVVNQYKISQSFKVWKFDVVA